jgi:hypothetical protein
MEGRRIGRRRRGQKVRREKARVGRKAEEGSGSDGLDWPGIEGALADVDTETKEDNTETVILPHTKPLEDT